MQSPFPSGAAQLEGTPRVSFRLLGLLLLFLLPPPLPHLPRPYKPINRPRPPWRPALLPHRAGDRGPSPCGPHHLGGDSSPGAGNGGGSEGNPTPTWGLSVGGRLQSPLIFLLLFFVTFLCPCLLFPSAAPFLPNEGQESQQDKPMTFTPARILYLVYPCYTD